jgi:diguanylate cyclase (GGDEF)-like protein
MGCCLKRKHQSVHLAGTDMQSDKLNIKKSLPWLKSIREINKLSIFDPINKSFKGKIIIPAIVVLIALVIFMSYFLSIQFLEYSNTLIDEKIHANFNTLRLHIKEAENHAQVASFSMAINSEARRAIKKRDKEEIIRIFTSNYGKYLVNFFTICDSNGTVLARTHEPGSFGDSLAYLRTIADALKGKASSYFEFGTVVKVSARAAAPMYDTDGSLLGVISAGVRFDTDKAVDDLKALTQSDVTVFRGDTRIATTILVGDQRAVGTKLNPNIAKIVLEDKEEYIGNADILGTNYKGFYLPLLNDRGEAFAAFFIGNSTLELKHATNTLIIKGIMIGFVGLAVSIGLLYFIISALIRPVVILMKDMNDIATGNMDVDIVVESKDEIGRLTESLQKVVSNFYKVLNDIDLMISEHKKGNTDYRIDLGGFQGGYRKLVANILELADVGVKDHLTGMPNRRSFDSRLNLEWNHALRDKTPISLLMVDLDRFKIYNDTFGHHQGDLAMQEAAKVFSYYIKRGVDFAARWGGEEFAVLLPKTDSAGAMNIAEQIRNGIGKMTIPSTDARAAKITASAGVATLIPMPGSSSEQLILKADEALYQAKASGRNRVVFWEPE